MHVAKTKALLSCMVTMQLICAFVFVYAKIMFSHDASDIISHHLLKTEENLGSLQHFPKFIDL